jgi:hypothetical protein
MTETKDRRLSVILRLAAQGILVSPAEHRRLVAKNLVHPDGVVTAAGAELIEDLGPLPVRDATPVWRWEDGRYVTDHGGYRATVRGGAHLTIYGSPQADGHRVELYSATCGNVAGARVVGSDWIRAAENNTCDALGL